MPEIWYNTQLRDYERKLKKQTEEIERLKRELDEKEKENKELRDELRQMADRKSSKKPKFPDYSLTRQLKLKLGNAVFRSPGRRPKEKKMDEVSRTEDVYPEGTEPDECILAYTRIITHIREGKKETVLYRIHRKGRKKGKLPHVMPRGEYGAEVAVALAFLVYTMSLSHAAAAQILLFFCGIEISESEADSLLDQIGRLWRREFETLCDLVLLALFVHIDETGWKIKAERCFAWIFRTLSHTVLLYGEKRNGDVLDKILPRGKFAGVGITDCYRIYENYFPRAQKCWAHFLRKIIKLKLLYPQKKEYRQFFGDLFGVFKKAGEVKKNEKLTEDQKTAEIKIFTERVKKLCALKDARLNGHTSPDKREFVNLQKNLIRNLNDLFTFVLIPEVEPTNNRAEQGLRFTAKARNNYQTSKTGKGAGRRSVVASVLASLKQNLPLFSLKSVTEEVMRWQKEGKSLFSIQLEQLQLQRASP